MKRKWDDRPGAINYVDPRDFGRKPPRRDYGVRIIPCIILALGLILGAAALGLTFIDNVRPAAPFLIGLVSFTLILTAILSLGHE